MSRAFVSLRQRWNLRRCTGDIQSLSWGMASCLNDRQVIAAIGAEALAGAGFNPEQVKKWRQRGIPWRLRAIVADMAKRKRLPLPPDFLSQRKARSTP